MNSRTGWVLIITLWLAFAAAYAQTADFRVKDLVAKVVDGVHQVSLKLDLSFSEEMLEALRNGVPLVVQVDIEVVQPRYYWWDNTLVSIKQRYQLRYHALSQSYVVRNLNTDAQESMRTLSAALDALATMNDIPVVDASLIPATANYVGRLRVMLDIDALPLPLKMRAYTRPEWRAASDWRPWQLQ
ncbi:MAG: DUF4390 domain-containing protein [Thiotrichales bacterium]